MTAIALTKLDGTAKGGIVIAVSDALQIPVKFVGVGEQADDLMLVVCLAALIAGCFFTALGMDMFDGRAIVRMSPWPFPITPGICSAAISRS